MKKSLLLFALAAFAASSSFATYVVMLKDGTRYLAKAKWTVVNGKAIVQLENGQALQLDPSLIDGPRSEQATKLGLTNANVIDLNPNMPEAQTTTARPSLGSQIKLRKPAENAATPPPVKSVTPPVATNPGAVPPEVIDRFDRAFENVGIFEKKVVSTGGNSLRADLVTDTEERVFNAISAASFLMVRNAGQSVRIDMVELYMRTTTGGIAGRFQMTREDAEALDKHTISQQEYFVRKVLY
ncbi:MAG: hypothetical protein JO197_19785 [Acidobacteria bacterium]|nr:hypothetical protein [Acidobacteriota bacterium]MBV9478601.1 hypothetical protein [Acidobacteriota bacterium]